MRNLSKYLTLKLDSPEWEREFNEYFDRKFLPQTLASFALAAILILCDATFDHFIQEPEQIKDGNAIRTFILVPLMIIGFGLYFVPAFRKRYQQVITIWMYIVVLPLIAHLHIIHIKGGMGLHDWVGTIYYTMMMIFVYLLLGVRIQYSLWLGIYLYLICIVFIALEPNTKQDHFTPMAAYHAFTMLALGIFVGYWKEILIRNEFKLIKNLEQERGRSKQLLMQVDMKRDVFFSHSSNDMVQIDKLALTLGASSISSWYAPRDIPTGMNWRESIVNAISAASVFLILLSRPAAESVQILKELELAKKYGIPILPILVDPDLNLAAGLDYELAGVQYFNGTIGDEWDYNAICLHVKEFLSNLDSRQT